jgi:hypothetical protein
VFDLGDDELLDGAISFDAEPDRVERRLSARIQHASSDHDP